VFAFAFVFISTLAVDAISSTKDTRAKEGVGFKVLVKGEGGWTESGTIPFGTAFEKRTLDLAGGLPDVDEEYKVRISHPDVGMANLDNVSIEVDGRTLKLLRAYDVSNREDLKAKLGSRDYDVINVQGKTLEFVFEATKGVKGKARLAAVGREEDPNNIPGGPCAYPSSSRSKSDASFTYRLNQNKGALKMDGAFTRDDALGKPIFKTMTRPISGHPDGYTYGYLKNDDRYLYGAVDFTSDNTYDGTEDFAALVIKTPDGWKEHRVKVGEERWGKPGFALGQAGLHLHRQGQIPAQGLRIQNSPQGPGALRGRGRFGRAEICGVRYRCVSYRHSSRPGHQ
jgi:hypothetical protein